MKDASDDVVYQILGDNYYYSVRSLSVKRDSDQATSSLASILRVSALTHGELISFHAML